MFDTPSAQKHLKVAAAKSTGPAFYNDYVVIDRLDGRTRIYHSSRQTFSESTKPLVASTDFRKSGAESHDYIDNVHVFVMSCSHSRPDFFNILVLVLKPIYRTSLHVHDQQRCVFDFFFHQTSS